MERFGLRALDAVQWKAIPPISHFTSEAGIYGLVFQSKGKAQAA
jgi:hypothetical protein